MKLDNAMRKIPAWAVIVCGLAIIFTAAFLTALVGMDYPAHEEIVKSLDLSSPAKLFKEHMEPMWHLMTYGVMHLLRCRVEIAAGLVSGFLYTLLFVIAFLTLRKAVPGIPASAHALGALVLHLCGAIYLPWFNEEPYLGQGSPNVWHNPTTIAVKPLALLFFVLLGSVLVSSQESNFEKKQPVWKYILLAVLLLLTNLAKPSFVQIYYPAIFVLMIIWLIMYQRKNLSLAIALFITCIPSLALTITQFVLSFYSDNKGASGVRFAPFEVAGQFTRSIFGSFLLAAAFPIVMLILDAVRRKIDWDTVLAWLMLAMGFAERLLLAESGERASHGNFSWGYLLGLYLIWYCAVRSLLRRAFPGSIASAAGSTEGAAGSRFDFGLLLAAIVLVLHLISGMYYVFIYMIVQGHGL